MSAKSFPNRPGVYGNVAVADVGNHRHVQLHTTVVASLDNSQDIAVINAGGYSTPTTRTAINRALTLWEFKGYVAIQGGELFYFTPDGKSVASIDNLSLAVRKDGSLAGSRAVSYPELAG